MINEFESSMKLPTFYHLQNDRCNLCICG